MQEQNNFVVDFIGVGAQKAGTTWLADFLFSHPQVCVSEPKEPHYFNEKGSFAHNHRNSNFGKPMNWYKKHFAHWQPGQLRGEFSTDYISDQVAPKLIHQHFPQTKIILSVRNPIDRAYSHYRMYMDYLLVEKRDLATALRQEPEYIERGKYFEQLQNYLKYFDREQIHIVFFEDIVAKPTEVLTELCEFLDIETEFARDYNPSNSKKSKAIRFKFVSELMRIFSETMIKLGLSGWLVKLKQIGVKDFFMGLNSREYDYEKLTPELREYIYDQVKDDIVKFSDFTGRDLSAWK